MKRRFYAVLLFTGLLGATPPAPLLTGSVRDQYGEPVAGADVYAGEAHVRTDEKGTFALPIAGAQTVRIRCAYCAPAVILHSGDEPIVAIVRRFSALSQASPSARDIAFLPYAHAESDLALRRFTVLSQSADILPGSRISDRGASLSGSLLIDDGIANYDIASDSSPFVVFPSYDASRAEMRGPSDAFLYGDQASGGIALIETQPQTSSSDGSLLGGSSSAFRSAQTGDPFSYAAGASLQQQDWRERLDARLRKSLGSDSLTLTAIGSRENSWTRPALSSGFTGIRFDYDRERASQMHASFVADRAGYDASVGSAPLAGEWSDVDARLGFASNDPIHTFLDFGYRASSGFYDASYAGVPRVAGTVVQGSADAGVQLHGDRYDLQGGVGAFSFSYSGGTYGYSTPLFARAIVPSISGSYDLGPQWKVSLQGSRSFRLPTLAEAYAFRPPTAAGDLPFDRNATWLATLEYTDLRRVSASVTALDERVSFSDNAAVHGIGASIVWQIAPLWALRAWEYHFEEPVTGYGPVPQFEGSMRPATVGSVWLTYENLPGLRADAIYRQDLLDFAGDRHIDASLSGPASPNLRWFAATEMWRRVRSYTAGLRLIP